MSRFWAGQSSGSENEDSDSDRSSSDDEINATKKKADNRWDLDSDSDSEEEVRKVVSAKDKAWEAMETDVKQVRNNMKNNDWANIQSKFEELNKKVEKQQNLIQKEGGVPKFYIRLLVDLEDLLMATLKDKEGQKKMSRANGRSLNRMKLSLRKHNANYEAKIKEYRENPQESDDEESSEQESSSDDERAEATGRVSTTRRAPSTRRRSRGRYNRRSCGATAPTRGHGYSSTQTLTR